MVCVRWLLAVTATFTLLGCGRSTRPVGEEDRKQAQSACAKPRGALPYSPELSKGMADDLERRCKSGDLACDRFKSSIARVCSYKNPRATILLSDAVEVYTTIGANDDLALNELCGAMRSVSNVGFLQDVDVFVARGGDPYWGKSFRRRCAQGSGSGGEHR